MIVVIQLGMPKIGVTTRDSNLGRTPTTRWMLQYEVPSAWSAQMTQVEASLSATTVSNHTNRRRAVWLWAAAVLLLLAPIPFLPLLRKAFELRLQSAGSNDGQIARNLAESISVFFSMLAGCSYIAGTLLWRPTKGQWRLLIVMVSMALLMAGFLVYDLMGYLRALGAL